MSNSDPKESVGLEIGAGAIVAALVRDGLPVTMSRRELDAGVIERGSLRRPKDLTAAVRELWRQERLPSKRVRIGIPNQLAMCRLMRLPDPGSREDLIGAIRLTGRELFDAIDLGESVIGVEELDRDGAQLTVSVTAVERTELSALVKAIERAGLQVVGAETGASAQVRALVAPIDPLEVSLVVSLGPQETTVILAERGGVSFLRSVTGGVASMREAIAAGDRTPAQAQALLERVGFAAELPAGVDPALASEVQNRILGPFDVLVQQIGDTVDFARASRLAPLGRMVITGEGAAIPGLAAQIAQYIPVAPLLPAQGVDALDGVPDFGTYAAALALSAAQGADLLERPKAGRRARPAAERREDARVSKGGRARSLSQVTRRSRGKERSIPKPYLAAIVAISVGVTGMVFGARQLQTGVEDREMHLASLGQSAAPAPARFSDSSLTAIAAGRLDLATPLRAVGTAVAGVPGARLVRIDLSDGTFSVDVSGPRSAGAAVLAKLEVAGLQAEAGAGSAGVNHLIIRTREAS